MLRYLIEVSYYGKNYSGFQTQKNASTIQSEVERALQVYYRQPFALTGSSRTDAGVHALQNYFHVDMPEELGDQPGGKYGINAILPSDISVKNIRRVADDFHSRFDAVSRQYVYKLYFQKDPFAFERAWLYPYTLDEELLREAAEVIKEYKDFQSFSKRNSQVYTYQCNILESGWQHDGTFLNYSVTGNRFLRGMVRGLVGTMLQVGRKKISMQAFREIIEGKDSTRANFAVPPYGLYLCAVNFPG